MSALTVLSDDSRRRIMNRSVRMRRACMWLLAALLPILMSACSTVGSSSGSPVSLDDRPSMNCDELSAAVIERARSGDTAGFINQQIDQLSKNCPDEYNIAIDYMSTAAIASNWDIRPCDDLEADGLHPEAIRLLYADGLCTSEPLIEAQFWPENGLGWNEAADYVGTYQRVCGPLMSVIATVDGIFFNIGKDYPSVERFTFIVWGDW